MSITDYHCAPDAAKITGGQRFVYNVTVGTKVPIECNARGQPPPKLELLVENDSVSIIHYHNYCLIKIFYNILNL